MNKYFYLFFLTALFSGISSALFAQASKENMSKDSLPDTTLNINEVKTHTLKFGVDYISNNVFMGRTGINTTPIISPEIKYVFKSGLYFSGDADILPDNKSNKFNAGDLSAGYQFNINDNLDGDVSYTKMFYSLNSTLVGSSITNMFDATFDYEIGDVLTPSINADYAINSGGAAADIFINAGIAHDFIFEKLFSDNDAIIFSPTVSANLGTQNFYSAYIKNKVYKNQKLNELAAHFESNLGQFELLDYELFVPLEYKIGHFLIEFTPTYAIVENGFKSPVVAKAVGLSDKSSVFYVEAGLSLKFK
jgi:hypothetical protein